MATKVEFGRYIWNMLPYFKRRIDFFFFYVYHCWLVLGGFDVIQRHMCLGVEKKLLKVCKESCVYILKVCDSGNSR